MAILKGHCFPVDFDTAFPQGLLLMDEIAPDNEYQSREDRAVGRLGRAASSSMYEVSRGHPVLSIYLDPISLLVTIPPARHGHQQMAAFCRQLAGSAGHLANMLDSLGGA
ncbi:MAG: hypothetical protein ACRDQ5_24880 [Sciscionella sp.]